MDIVKKNIVSILCGVVALIGIILWFFPIGGMYEGLEGEVKARAAVYTQVKTLTEKPRNLPNLVLEETERQQLGRFPNEKVIAVGEDATKAITAQSTKMLGTVTQLNHHKLLLPGSLPKPTGSTPFVFTQEYLTRLGLIEDGIGLPTELKATTPPTIDELNDIAQEVWDKKYAVQVIEIGGDDNKEDVDKQFIEEMSGLQDKERKRRAQENMIYLSPDGLPASPHVVPGRVAPTPAQIWFAQNVLWIEEDVVASINAANAEAKNVLDAPVKHLVALSVPFGPEQYVMAGAPKAASSDGSGGGTAIPRDANGAPAVWSASPTGRVSNELYDVVHFDLVLRVDARKVPQVIAALERNQLVTVLKANVAAVDSAAELKQWGYVYGNDPVVSLGLQCEILFLRSWTTDSKGGGKNAVMPDDVQQVIGAKAPPAAEEAAG